jgi:hypothetical protein
MRFKLNPQGAADNTADSDGDGYTNIEEYASGTDPRTAVDYTKPENNRDSLQPQAGR